MIDSEFPTGRPPPLGRGLVLTLAASAAIVAGLGYYAFSQGSRARLSAAELTETKTALERERAAQQKKLVVLQQADSEQRERLTQRDADLQNESQKLAAAESRLDELENEREALTDRADEFKRLSKQFQRMVDSGKLSVSFRRGRMIVELPDAVLFASGSAELSADGKAALKDVAKILRQVPSKHFIVGGHTDDVPLAKGQSTYSSNWALSAARAVTVTEALVDADVKPTRLVASGFGPYDPIASNASPKGRKKNRRIEIVLEPDLTAVPKALKAVKKSAKKSARKKKK